MTFQIRNFTPGDFQLVRDWANKEKWNEGFYDHLAFKQIDMDGLWMGVLDGQPISTCTALQYDENFAFVGLYITKPEFRGKGYGFQVWKRALSRITAKSIALQGAKQQEQNYVKSGFKTYHNTVRYMVNGTNKEHYSPNLIECKDVDFEKLSAYDRQNFPAERKSFLRKWITLPESHGKAFVKDGKIEGYGVLRISQQGLRLGPLFADSYEVASQILMNLRGSVSEDKKIFIDIPVINKNALKLAEELNMKPGFTFARMYTNQIPNLSFDKSVYGITSLEFG